MTVDVSKIRVGDEVLVRMKVHENDGSDNLPLRLGLENTVGGWYVANDIVEHRPKPRPVEIGCWVNSTSRSWGPRKVIAISALALCIEVNDGLGFVTREEVEVVDAPE